MGSETSTFTAKTGRFCGQVSSFFSRFGGGPDGARDFPASHGDRLFVGSDKKAPEVSLGPTIEGREFEHFLRTFSGLAEGQVLQRLSHRWGVPPGFLAAYPLLVRSLQRYRR